MTDEVIKQNLFKWIIELMIGFLIIAFGFQQNQISKLDGRLEGLQFSTNSKLEGLQLYTNNNITPMKEDIASIKEGMFWIKERLGGAQITK